MRDNDLPPSQRPEFGTYVADALMLREIFLALSDLKEHPAAWLAEVKDRLEKDAFDLLFPANGNANEQMVASEQIVVAHRKIEFVMDLSLEAAAT